MRQDDRAADRITKLGQDVLRIHRLVDSLKEASRSKPAVCVVTPTSAVKGISATFNTDIDRRTACETLLSVEGVGDNVHLLDRLRRWHVNRVGWQPRVNDTRTVNLRVVLQARHAVDIIGDGSLRVTGCRVI